MNSVRGVQLAVLLVPVKDVALVAIFLPIAYLADPFAMFAAGEHWQKLIEYCLEIARNAHVYAHVLVQFRSVDVDVNLARVGRIGGEITGYTIIEAHPEGQDEV